MRRVTERGGGRRARARLGVLALAGCALVGSAVEASGAATSTVPSAPRSIRSTPGNGRATLRWHAPDDTGGHPITQYKIVAYNEAQSPLPTRLFRSSATTYVYPGLQNAKTYTFSIAAKNKVGWSPYSHRSDPVRIGVPLRPGKPTAKPGKARATVSWQTPNGNGATVKAYRVTPILDGHAQKARLFNSMQTHQVITGLQGGRRYAFTVAAHNNRGWSAPSKPSAAIITGK